MSSEERKPSAVDQLADGYVDAIAQLDPFSATQSGIKGYDNEVTDYSPEGFEARANADRDLLVALEKLDDQDDTDRVTRAALKERLGLQIAAHEALIPQTEINKVSSPISSITHALDQMPMEKAEDFEDVVQRLHGIPRSLSGWRRSLHTGAEANVIASKYLLENMASYVDSLLAPGGYFQTLTQKSRTFPNAHARVLEAMEGVAEELKTTSDYLRALTEHGRDSLGVGRDAYPLFSQMFLGEKIDLDETYAWGWEELQRIISEQEQVATRINTRYGNAAGKNVEAAREALCADEKYIIHGTANLRSWMQELSDKAVSELAGTHFDIPEKLTHLQCMIGETGSGGIYYTAPSEDFTRPGRMWWDVAPGTDTFHTWMEATTVYHEGVPGHHLQLGTQVMQAHKLNRWRALMCWVSGHGEGWALYAERLMQSLGYLDDDGDYLGMLDAQRMRAARVVLDIGIHCGMPMPGTNQPWTMQSAKDFMLEHWIMDPGQRQFELDRYLGWPGQAPSYKIGQRLWEQLRDASANRGEDVRDFHRRALELGALPLSVLKEALN